MAQDWYTPEAVEAVAVAPRAAAFELRPLSLGEVLDRTFSVYRAWFWLFAGMAAVAASLQFAGNLVVLLVKHIVIVHYGLAAGRIAETGGAGLVALVFLVPAAVTQAATVHALSEVYLGRHATAMGAFRATVGRWYRYVGIAFWLSWSFFWLPALLWIPGFVLLLALRSSGLAWLAGILIFLGFCSIPFGVWSALRNSLGVQSTVIEGLTVRASMRRSKVLTQGAKWRVFVVLLIVFALLMTSGVLQLPLVLVVARRPLEEHVIAQILTQLINFLSQTVVTPIGLIGLSLVYFDQRVRQEGFDLLMLLGPEAVVAPVAYVAPAGYEQPVADVPAPEAEADLPSGTNGDDGAA